MPPVNLLPWRQNRRRALLRFWALMFGALPLLVLVLLLWGHARLTHAEAIQAIYVQEAIARNRAISDYEQRLQTRLSAQAELQQRQRQRRETARWEQALVALAERLPEQAWLTDVGWQNGALTLNGLAAHFDTLSLLERELKMLPGYHAVIPGATRRDEAGRWQFSYQMVRTRHEPESS